MNQQAILVNAVKRRVRGIKLSALSAAAIDQALRHSLRPWIISGKPSKKPTSKIISAAWMRIPGRSLLKRGLTFDDHKHRRRHRRHPLADPSEKPHRPDQMATELDEGLDLYRVTCPIGVIGIVFESRPDAFVQILPFV